MPLLTDAQSLLVSSGERCRKIKLSIRLVLSRILLGLYDLLSEYMKGTNVIDLRYNVHWKSILIVLFFKNQGVYDSCQGRVVTRHFPYKLYLWRRMILRNNELFTHWFSWNQTKNKISIFYCLLVFVFVYARVCVCVCVWCVVVVVVVVVVVCVCVRLFVCLCVVFVSEDASSRIFYFFWSISENNSWKTSCCMLSKEKENMQRRLHLKLITIYSTKFHQFIYAELGERKKTYPKLPV